MAPLPRSVSACVSAWVSIMQRLLHYRLICKTYAHILRCTCVHVEESKRIRTSCGCLCCRSVPCTPSVRTRTLVSFNGASNKQALQAHLDVGVLLLQVPAGSSDGATCADAADKDVNVAASLLPDLGPGGLVVDLESVDMEQDERKVRG